MVSMSQVSTMILFALITGCVLAMISLGVTSLAFPKHDDPLVAVQNRLKHKTKKIKVQEFTLLEN